MVKWGWYDVSEVYHWGALVASDRRGWRPVASYLAVAVGGSWVAGGGQMSHIPQYHFIEADSSSEKYPILVRSVAKLCVMLYSTRIDDGGA